MKYIGFILMLLIIGFFPVTSFAGGGLISTEVYLNNGAENSDVALGEQFIVRPTVRLAEDQGFCVGCPIIVRLENPQPGDLINQSAEKTDDHGEIYAKVRSYVPGVRFVYSEVQMPNGSIYQGSRYALNYVSDESMPVVTPIAKPTVLPSFSPSTRPVVMSSAKVISPSTKSAESQKSVEGSRSGQVTSFSPDEQAATFLEKVLNRIKSWFSR